MNKEQLEAMVYTDAEVKDMLDKYRSIISDINARIETKTALIDELKNKIESRDETITHLKDLIKAWRNE